MARSRFYVFGYRFSSSINFNKKTNFIQSILVRNINFANYPKVEIKYVHDFLNEHSSYSRSTIKLAKVLGNHSTSNKKCNINCNNQESTVNNEVKSVVNQNISDFSHLINIIEGSVTLEIEASSKMLKYLKRYSSSLSDSDLIELLLSLIPITTRNTKIYKKNLQFFNYLKNHCLAKCEEWTANQLLLISDIWFGLGVPVSIECYSKMLDVLFGDIKSINPHQFVQSCFYLSLLPKQDISKNKLFIERKIGQIINYLSIEELGIIAMGFFKTKNSIDNPQVLKKIVSALVSNKENVPDIFLSSILKLLRLSLNGNHFNHEKLCKIIFNEFKTELNRLNNLSLVHLATIGNPFNFYDEDLLNDIIDRLVQDLPSLRLKELERISLITMNSKVPLKNCPNFFELIEQELLRPCRKEENMHFFSSYLSCVHYLVYSDQYNSTLVSDALKFNDYNVGQKKTLKREYLRPLHLFELDLLRKIEDPFNYQGHELSENFSLSLMSRSYKKFELDNPNPSRQGRYLLQLVEIMPKIMSSDCYKVFSVLPSSLPEIVFCTDANGNIETFPSENFNSSSNDLIKRVPKSEASLIWYALMLVNKNCYLHGSDRIRGSIASRIRFMEKLGYSVIMINASLLERNIEEEKKLQNVVKKLEEHVDLKSLNRLVNSSTC